VTRSGAGFSLVELIIATAIVAILTAIAYPAFRRHAIRANRADAQAQLLQLAQWMERYYSIHDAYWDSNHLPPDLPAGLRQSPATGRAVYRIDWSPPPSNAACPAAPNPSATAFCLQASPVPGSLNGRDGFLQIDAQGGRYWDADDDGRIGPAENSWLPAGH